MHAWRPAFVALAVSVSASSCGGAPPASSPKAGTTRKDAPAPPRAVRPFEVVHREAANAFVILDELSLWFPEKNDAEYRDYWKSRFGLTAADEARLSAWAAVRKRTYRPESGDDGVVLGRVKPVDELAAIFHRERDLATALGRATEHVGAEDGATMRATFEHFRPQLDALLSESGAFASVASSLQERLDDPRVGRFVGEVARFYRSGELPSLTVVLVWWPPVDATTASVAGDVLLLRANPQKHGADAAKDIDVPIHEIVHVASSRQPAAQKAALSAAFVAKCGEPPKLSPALLLEEPLAVAHQKMFVAELDPKRLDRTRSWYGDPWVSALAKSTFDAVVRANAERRVLDEALVLDAGRACRELVGVGKELARSADRPR